MRFGDMQLIQRAQAWLRQFMGAHAAARRTASLAALNRLLMGAQPCRPKQAIDGSPECIHDGGVLSRGLGSPCEGFAIQHQDSELANGLDLFQDSVQVSPAVQHQESELELGTRRVTRHFLRAWGLGLAAKECDLC